MVARKIWRAGADISQWATIAAAVVAALTLYFGFRQFRETQDATRQNLALQRDTFILQNRTLDMELESRAVDLFIKYNEVMAQPTPPRRTRKGADDLSWRDNLAITIAESIFIIRREDEGWKATVKWMLENHTDYLKKTGVDCTTFDREFIDFVKQMVPELMCVAPGK